jgi:D-glycero-D-manno-heptose 1,7-bisphosphate phosphatase
VRPAIFLDRDGVLNDLVPDPRNGCLESPLHPDDVVLLPGVVDAVNRAREAGYVIVGVSNQPAAAKGTVTLAELEAVQSRLVQLLDDAGAILDAMYICFHHPDGVVPPLSGSCNCRKPRPGMLLDAAAEHDLDLGASFLVGDTDADVGAANAAGVDAVLVEHSGSSHKRSGSARARLQASDLPSAVGLILRGASG